MKTIKKNKKIKRVSDSNADHLVEEEGWSFCSKSEWKEKVRDPKKNKPKEKKKMA